MNINFKQIEAFVWVADLGSFRKAAQRLTVHDDSKLRAVGLDCCALGAAVLAGARVLLGVLGLALEPLDRVRVPTRSEVLDGRVDLGEICVAR